MKIRKIAALVFFPLLIVSFLHSQSVVELAKKEKERRAALKGKRAPVVTNIDLLKVKKKPAVQIVDPSLVLDETLPEDEIVSPPVVGEGEDEAVAEEEAGAEEASQIQTLPSPEEPVISEMEFKTRLRELQAKVNDSQERADLLSLKMNALWQEFYGLDDMKSRELIQLQISETYDKLTTAQFETSKAQKELDDFVVDSKREGVPDIWIR